MKVYVAGGISGIPTWKVKANFQRGVTKLKVHGPEWVPVVPLDIKPEPHNGLCPRGRPGGDGHNEACNLRADLKELLECDAIFLLEGWESSWGASLELQVARAAGLKIMFEWQMI